MPALNRPRLPRPVLGFLLLAVSCSGCLKGDVFEYVAYDRTTDTFKFLQLDVNIAAETAGDLDHMADLWKQRQQIIAYPTLIRIFGLPAILRVDANHYKAIDLALAATEEKPAEATPIALDSIKIQPGKFFLSRDKTLCYFHEITVSGKIVDQVLIEQSKDFCQEFGDEIDHELKRRADGGKPLSWDDLRRDIEVEYNDNKDTDQKDTAANGKPTDAPQKTDDKDDGWPGDDVSLGLLKKATAAGEIAIHRRGSEFSLSLPLSPEDCRQAKATLDLNLKLTLEHAKTQAKENGDAEPLPEFRAEIEGGKRLVLKTDVKQFMGLTGKSLADAKPDPKLTTNYRDALAFVGSHGIALDEKLTAKQIIDGFRGKR